MNANATPAAKTNNYLKVSQAAALLDVSVSVLNKWRTSGEGPKYFKVGRLIRYRSNELNEWISQKSYQSTSEY